MTAIRKRMLKISPYTMHNTDAAVRRWLKLRARGAQACPWPLGCGPTGNRMCKAMFPRLKLLKVGILGDYFCPCGQYPASYVEKRAREALT